MAGARPILGLLAILVLAGGIVMQFFVILSGLEESPLDQIYFLQASTTGITGADDRLPSGGLARWTYLTICGVADGLNANCNPIAPAIPFDPRRNFGTTTGLPQAFAGGNYWFYISRFAWAFYLIAVFFAVVAFFLSVFALVARLGAYLTSFTSLIAVFFQGLAAALTTAWVIRGRDAFRSNGMDASVGVKAVAFIWAAFACWFVAAVLFCIGGTAGKNNTSQKSSYFGRKKSTRSRGSFVDGSERRVVKDEYE